MLLLLIVQDQRSSNVIYCQTILRIVINVFRGGSMISDRWNWEATKFGSIRYCPKIWQTHPSSYHLPIYLSSHLEILIGTGIKYIKRGCLSHKIKLNTKTNCSLILVLLTWSCSQITIFQYFKNCLIFNVKNRFPK